MRLSRPARHPHTGFTLIELLVVVGIMALIFGTGLATYIGFNDKQALLAAGTKTMLMMRTAQKKARVGDTPAGCTQMQAYEVKVATDLQTVSISAVCNNSGTTVRVPVETYVTPSNILFQSAVTMQFLGLRGGVTNPGTVMLILNGNRSFSFTVDQGGSISDGTVASYP